MSKHTESPMHQELFIQKSEGHKKLHQRCVVVIKSCMHGVSKSRDEKEYRCGALIAAANGNVPLSAIKYFAEWANEYSNMTGGDKNHLIRDYIVMVNNTLIGDIRKLLCH